MPRDFERSRRLRRRAAGALVFGLVVLAAAVVVIPFRTILPFKAQTPEGVALSYTLTRWGTAITLVAALGALVLAAWLWRGARWWAPRRQAARQGFPAQGLLVRLETVQPRDLGLWARPAVRLPAAP